MAKKPLYDLSKGELQWAINTAPDGKSRYGFAKKYNPTGITTEEAIAQCTLDYDSAWPSNGVDTTKTVTVWNDGSITLDDAAAIAVANIGTNRWAQIFPAVVPAWDISTLLFKPKNVAILITTGKLYIVDPTEPVASTVLYEYPMARTATPLGVSAAAGSIQAGTYYFVTTEVTQHGVESPKSIAISYNSATDFQYIVAHSPFTRTDTARWRLYMARLGAGGDISNYRFVGEAPA